MYTIFRPESIDQNRLAQIEISEYTDLHYLKQSVDYAFGLDDSPIIKRKNRKDYLKYYATFDIETTTIKPHTLYNESDKPFAFAYSYQFYFMERTWIFRTEEHWKHFIELLAYYLDQHKCCLVIYTHNLSYEWQFQKSVLDVVWKSVFALQSRKIGKFCCYDNTLEFRCSYLLSNMSLEKFTENYCTEEYRKDKELIDYEIIRFPWTELTNDELYYNAMDVLTLHKAIQSIMDREHDDIKTIPMTNTGYVRRSCRIACLGENTKHYRTEEEKRTYKKCKDYKHIFYRCKIDQDMYALLTDAFRGGNTHANRFRSGIIIDDVGSVDFASSYPAILILSGEFPMGKMMDLESKYIDTIENMDYYSKRYWTVTKMAFLNLRLKNPDEVKCPYIPESKISWDHTDKSFICFKDNGRVMETKGICMYTFLGCEWELIKEQYTWDAFYPVKAYYTSKGYLPYNLRKVVFDWYKAKTELKGVDGKEYEYMKSKNRVNAAFGMMVQRMIMDIIECLESGEMITRRPTPEEIEKQFNDYYAPRQQKFLAYQWGVTITALARIRHMELIKIVSQKNDGNDFIYGDTDSVKCTNFEDYRADIAAYNQKWIKYAEKANIPFKAYTLDGEEQILGYADEETPYIRFSTLGAKKYAYEQWCKNKKTGQVEKHLGITIAGVPKEIGAKILGSLEHFHSGFIFYVPDNAPNEIRQKWKKELTYRDDTDFYLKVGEHSVHVGTCIAMTRTTYELSLAPEYERLIGYDEDMIFEEDPEIWG